MACNRSVRSCSWKLLFVVLACLALSLKPRTASDPVLPVQSGQSPSTQGTMVSGSVSQFSGTYSTSIPVEVPPGRNGLQPAIAISYSSSNQDGLAGVGWGIPSSSIARTGPSKGAPTYMDGDEFYMSLNGNSVQLMPIDDVDQGTGVRHFRTRIESWSNVVAHYLSDEDANNNPVLTSQIQYWDVWSKSGEHYYFGPLPTPLVPSADVTEAYCLAFSDATQPVGYQQRRNQWMLRKVVDVDGNCMEYEYCQGSQNAKTQWNSANSFLPSLIKWGNNQNLSGYSHFAGVKFSYEERPDKRFSYRNGIEQKIGDRLKTVVAGRLVGDDVPYASGGTPDAREYTLSYGISRTTGRSLMTRVDIKGTASDGVETALAKPILFSYADYQSQPVSWSAGAGQYASLPGMTFSEGFYKYGATDTEFGGAKANGSMLMDLNGDGLPDKVDSYHSYDAGTGAQTNVSEIYLNLGQAAQGQQWMQVPHSASDPSKQLSIPGQPVAYWYVYNQYEHSTLDTGVRFADVNGDGVPDKIDSGWYTGQNASNSVYLGRKNGTGWDPHVAGVVHHVPNTILTGNSLAAIRRSGAGLSTRAASGTSGVDSKTLSTGTRFAVAPSLPVNPPGDNFIKLSLMFTPPSSSAGGRAYFFWSAGGDCDAQGEGVAVSYYLEGLESTWIPSSAGIQYVKYSNLSPGSYTFHVKAINMCGKSKQVNYPFTVVAGADHVPPAVAFTQVPQDGFNDTLDFAWTGSDTSDNGGPGTSPLTFQYRLLTTDALGQNAGTGNSVSCDTTNVYGGGTLLVMAYDGAGNMTPIEWSFDGGHLAPPIQNVVWVSNGQGIITVNERGTAYVDLNGDGYTDIVEYYSDQYGSQRGVWLFNPHTFQWESTTQWIQGAMDLVGSDGTNPVDTGVRFADMNGDGLPDMVKLYHDDTNNVWVKTIKYNTGSGWTSEPNDVTLSNMSGEPLHYFKYLGQSGGAPMNTHRDQGAWLLDINGDGLPDKVDGWVWDDATTSCADGTSVEKNVWLNNGITFSAQEGLAPYQTSPDTTAKLPGYAFSEPYTTTLKAGVAKSLCSRDTGVRAVDLNGDGLPDFVRDYTFTLYNSSQSIVCQKNARKVYVGVPQNGQSPRLDYLTEVTNPIGGKTEIYYKAAVDSYTPNLPANASDGSDAAADFNPGIPYVVDHVTLQDGKDNSYTTSYRYQHPKWDVNERQFAGFREVVVIGPDNTSSRTTYKQDFPLTGMVEKTESYDTSAKDTWDSPATWGSATPFQVSSSTYEVLENSDRSGVWHVHKLTDRTTVTEGGNSLTTGVDYKQFDRYDNALVVQTLGDVTTGSDDKYVATQYINDEGRWLIGFVSQVDTLAADETTLTSSKKMYYDNLPWGHIAKGHATKEENWLDIDTSSGAHTGLNDYLSSSTVAYYADGTIASRTDALAILTTFDTYDATHRFPIQKNVHGKQGYVYTTLVTPDFYGRPLAVTDAKSVKTETAYDGLGRPLREQVTFGGTGPFDTKDYFYHDDLMGQPNAQYAEVVTHVPGSDPRSIAKYDGMGRTYQATSIGFGSQPVTTETAFNQYGQVSMKSRPHFASTPVKWIQYAYDDRGRLFTETGFGKTTETDYAILNDNGLNVLNVKSAVSGTGDNGVQVTHQKVTESDAYGRTVMVQHDTMPKVYYAYDVMGALIAAHQGTPSGPTLVELTYDSWGHKLTYKDYDAGALVTTTNYFYDHSGRLIRQKEIPAANPGLFHMTDLSYNGDLGQLTSRVGTDESGTQVLTETLAYYGATSNPNAGELHTRADASGTYTFSTSFIGDQVYTNTVAQVAGYPVPFSFGSYKDWAGRTVRTELPSGQAVAYTYYGDSGLPDTVTDGAATTYARYDLYDETHLVQWTRMQNGIQTTYTHDANDRLTDITSVKGQEAKQNLHYAFYGDDQVWTVTDAVNGYNQSFTYDASMRLTQAAAPGKYGVLNYTYDDSISGGGRLATKGGYYGPDENGAPTNGDVQLMYDQSFAHRVTGTSDGANLTYDAWGNVAKETKADGTILSYHYDAWNRMTSVTQTVLIYGRLGDPPRREMHLLASYVYDASGERIETIKPTPDGMSRCHLFLGGYESEALDAGGLTTRERWAVSGPNGLICWNQQIGSSTAYFERVGKRGEYALAAIAWDKFKGDITTEKLRRGDGFLGFVGAEFCPRPALCGTLLSAGKDLWQAASHGAKGFGYDHEAQAWAAQGALLLMGVMLLLLVSSRKVRRALTSQLRKGISPVVLRKLTRQGAFEGDAETPSPLGPWNIPALRGAARLMILVMIFQGVIFFMPLQAQAQSIPCADTFYPLSDNLGSVNILTEHNGNVVLTQHFLPFGENFEDPKPTVNPDACNNSDPWPYGFTGQYHDDESRLIYFHARYYDPEIGHFTQADSVVPNPSDTYSYDRYAYCRNNPINLTDPTGHFSLGDFLMVLAIAVVAYFTATAVTAALAQASATTTAGTVAAEGTTAGTAATAEATITASTTAATSTAAGGAEAAETVASAASAASSATAAASQAPLWAQMAGKATGEVVGGLLSGERNPKNLLFSAVSGAACAGINVQFKGKWTITRVMEETAVSTATTAGQGGDVGRAALFAAGSSLANLAYQKMVGWAASPRAGKGSHEKNLGQGAIKGYSNFGLSYGPQNQRTGVEWWLSEQSPLMRATDKIPGMEAIADLHDTWMAPVDFVKNKFVRTIVNIAFMAPAAMISTTAIIGQSPTAISYAAGFNQRQDNQGNVGVPSAEWPLGGGAHTGILNQPWEAWQ